MMRLQTPRALGDLGVSNDADLLEPQRCNPSPAVPLQASGSEQQLFAWQIWNS